MSFTGTNYINMGGDVPIWAQNNPNVNTEKLEEYRTPEITATSAGQSTWEEYLDNAYKDGLPSRLNELNATIQSGTGIDDHMINRAIWEDAMWGGAKQDIPDAELIAAREEMNTFGGPGWSGLHGPYAGGFINNSNQALDQLIQGYSAPDIAAPAGSYGGFFDHAQEVIDRSRYQGVPGAAQRQAADMSARITQAAIDNGDIATNTGLGPFAGILTLASFIPGAQGLAPLAGIANATANQDIFGGITSVAGFGGNPLNVLGGQNAQTDWLDILQGSHTAAGGFRDIFSSGEAQQDDSGNDGENETNIPIPILTGAPSSTSTQTTSAPSSVQMNRTGLLHNPGRYDPTYQPMRAGIDYFDLNVPMVNPMLLGDLYA